MNLSCCIWTLNNGRQGLLRRMRRFFGKTRPETKILQEVADLGFAAADIQPQMQKANSSRSTLQSLGLEVTSVAASFGAPINHNFAHENPDEVQQLADHLKSGIKHAANIGVNFCYVIPGPERENKDLSSIAPHYRDLAQFGHEQGVKIGIEHFPNTYLPTVSLTLDFINEINHPNLYLLFDIGHAQISKEDPAEVLPLAGDRLGFVHLDDNDGKEDLHLSLTEGVQSEDDLRNFFQVLDSMGYNGPVSLELHPNLPNPREALRRSKQIVDRIRKN
ncbi:MAG: hypothetical protein CMI18_04500 [Opitutaceae bacterium]|nr:hypothetical protein [Opitutaceae bacterium]